MIRVPDDVGPGELGQVDAAGGGAEDPVIVIAAADGLISNVLL
ncbi:hypothetical protein [Saccharopolyspora phatthalungensis]|uniref:Uncharacterized protein n=1 Tax=Saccharopolyspora phatthalungensis TaxID=664693 RepID=A0A840QFS5_9PSEU|nr:hypothetical protein [Saccharopolyspora phatthalungensis]MBB5157335.1 hypothetical protein [Saccharopolyspora phatthalungensis]